MDERNGQYEEKLLIAAARGGDPEAFDVLVRRHQDAIYNLTFRLSGSRDDAFELTQEVFMKAWRGLARFDGSCALYTWLYRIAVNTAFSARRGPGRREVSFDALAERDDERPAQFAADTADVSAAVETAERRALVQRAIARLSPDCRAVVVLRDLQQLGYAEIAEALNMPIGTVKSRLYRARIELKDFLKGTL